MNAIFFVVSVINNYAFYFHVPMTLHMIFRAVSSFQRYHSEACLRQPPVGGSELDSCRSGCVVWCTHSLAVQCCMEESGLLRLAHVWKGRERGRHGISIHTSLVPNGTKHCSPPPSPCTPLPSSSLSPLPLPSPRLSLSLSLSLPLAAPLSSHSAGFSGSQHVTWSDNPQEEVCV